MWGGGYFYGKKIFTPSEIANDKNAFILVCAFNTEAVSKIFSELNSLNIKHCHIDAAVFSLHKNELRRVFDILDDERSRDIYLTLLKYRARGEFLVEGCTSWDHSFVNPAFQNYNSQDVFVDCGAFVGDTIERFIWQHGGTLKRIIGFEPDEKNFRALEKRVRRLREEWNFSDEAINVYPYAVGEKSSMSYFRRHSEVGVGSSIVSEADEKTIEVKTVAIDDFMTEKFTFLKADVESYEYKMLLGASKSIAKWHPRLAICIYHNATDFYSIPLLVKELCPEYKLMIRHHLVNITETLLYAW